MKEPQSPDEWITFFKSQYETTNNPVHALQAYCCIPKTIHGNTVVPEWIADVLADGFKNYLTGLTEGGALSLGSAIGIPIGTVIERTSLDAMVEYVYLYRWLFGLTTGNAIAIVYKKYERDINSMELQLKHQGVTRKGTSFAHLYHSDHACKYESWAASAKASEFTEENRQLELASLDDETARSLKRKSPHYKKR